MIVFVPSFAGAHQRIPWIESIVVISLDDHQLIFLRPILL